jgi:hypothetical protein
MTEIDVIRRVFAPHSDGCYIEIGPWPDSPSDTLELRVSGKENEDYFGKFHLAMNAAFAAALGRALLASVKDLQPDAAHDTPK